MAKENRIPGIEFPIDIDWETTRDVSLNSIQDHRIGALRRQPSMVSPERLLPTG